MKLANCSPNDTAERPEVLESQPVKKIPLGQIFRCRRTSYGYGDGGSGLSFKRLISIHDLFADRFCIHCLVDDIARLGGCGRKLLDLALVKTV